MEFRPNVIIYLRCSEWENEENALQNLSFALTYLTNLETFNFLFYLLTIRFVMVDELRHRYSV